MAASLVKSLSKLCAYAPKAPQLLNIPFLKGTSSFQFSTFRQLPAMLNSKQFCLPSVKKSSPLDSCLIHTTPVCATTYERKLWREPRVIDRFYRLHWGAWIRTRGGRFKQLYKKSPKLQEKLQWHIFINRKQNKLLDVLVTDHWKQPKYFADTPYDPYHKRTNCIYSPNHKKCYP